MTTATNRPMATEITQALDTPPHEEPLAQTLRPVFKKFLESLDYTPTSKKANSDLYTSMHWQALSSGVPYKGNAHSLESFNGAVAVAEEMYPNNSLDVQIHIGMFTWLAFLVDDSNNVIADDLVLFHSRFYSGEPQPTPLLKCFAENLRDTYKYWDPVAANFIILSALSFVNADVLETQQEFQTMSIVAAAANWPYHIRHMNGLSEVYTYFMFPKLDYPDISIYLQAVPDIGKFINLTNDVLSFYKEEVAGETRNYIHTRAKNEEKPAMEVINSVIEESMQAFRQATNILDGHGKYLKAWQDYVEGYVTIHLITDRYMLADIGLYQTCQRR